MHSSTYDAGEALLSLRPELASLSPRKLVKRGYKEQAGMVLQQLEPLVAAWQARGESVIVEGVHLNLKVVTKWMDSYPNVVPFLVRSRARVSGLFASRNIRDHACILQERYRRQHSRKECEVIVGLLLQVHIKSEEKHAERMCVRAKYMAMDPARNKYVRNLRSIRIIQEYLLRAAEKASVPKVSNSNVDLSVSAIHATVLATLRRCVYISPCYLQMPAASSGRRHVHYEIARDHAPCLLMRSKLASVISCCAHARW